MQEHRGVPRRSAILGVAAGPGQGGGVDLHAVHDGVGASEGQGEGEGPGAGAEIDDRGVADLGDGGQAPGEEQLGLRPGHEDAGPDDQGDPVHGHPAGEVLQGDAAGPLGDQATDGVDHRGIHQRHHREPGPLDAEDVGGKQLGVDAGARHARRGQDPLGLEDGEPQGLPGHEE
jgi:hypothetical protein